MIRTVPVVVAFMARSQPLPHQSGLPITWRRLVRYGGVVRLQAANDDRPGLVDQT